DAQCLQGGEQGERAVGEQPQMLDAQVVRQLFFQLFVERAAVGDAFACPYLFKIGEELFPGRQMWLGYENRSLGAHGNDVRRWGAPILKPAHSSMPLA